MDIGRAFSYTFEDREWAMKLLITAAVAFASIILTPILVGFVGWAALLGYLSELIRNVRDGQPTPLPRWDNYAEKISKGGNVLAAVFVYSLPNFLPACCVLATNTFGRDSIVGGAAGVALCCVLPFTLVYNLITWPMLALGMARYSEERNIAVFFQFSDLFSVLYSRLNMTIQWLIFSLIINVILGLLGAIPCIGWVSAPALGIMLHGHLIAQLAEQIEPAPDKRKRA